MIGYKAKSLWVGLRDGELFNVYRNILHSKDSSIYLGIDMDTVVSIGIAQIFDDQHVQVDGAIIYNNSGQHLCFEVFILYEVEGFYDVYKDIGDFKKHISKVEDLYVITWYDVNRA